MFVINYLMARCRFAKLAIENPNGVRSLTDKSHGDSKQDNGITRD